MAKEYSSRQERKQMEMEKPSNVKPKKREGLWKKITLSILTLAVLCILGGVGTFYYLVSDAPKLDESKLKVPLSSTILDKNGNVIAELGTEQRTKVSYNEIPKVVEDAFIATEDVRFYKHKGVDIRRVLGAVLANFISILTWINGQMLLNLNNLLLELDKLKIKPINLDERVSFVLNQPDHYHSFIQLSGLYTELEKLYYKQKITSSR